MKPSTRLYLAIILSFSCNNGKGGTDTEAVGSHDSATDVQTSGDAWDVSVAALPEHQSIEAGVFASHDTCDECHSAVGNSDALQDAAGRDVSPVSLWSRTMMANAARDPYYLARLAYEIEQQPIATAVLEDKCTRCHAPAGNEQHAREGSAPTLAGMVAGEADADVLMRDGATCTVCHQLIEEGLGDPASYTGNFTIGDDREIFGPHADPFAHPMEHHLDYTPVYSSHMADSAVCASCHTVITQAVDLETGEVVGPQFPEQVPYLEWMNSAYAGADGASCQDCHMPSTDEDGVPIETVISTRPNNGSLAVRETFGRHLMVGGNAYMLELMADNEDWVKPAAGASALREAAAVTEGFLSGAARLELAASVEGDTLAADLTVYNLTGHKLPTGYPSRRIVVRLVVEDDAGEVLWASGRLDDSGVLVGASGASIDGVGVHPHQDTITDEDTVQLYESVVADADGQPTNLLLQGVGYSKDNRLLPEGWSASHPDIALMAPVGTSGDGDHVAGSDTTHYRIVAPEGAAVVRAALVYQAIPLVHVEDFSDSAAPLVGSFTEMAAASPDQGRVIAEIAAAL